MSWACVTPHGAFHAVLVYCFVNVSYSPSYYSSIAFSIPAPFFFLFLFLSESFVKKIKRNISQLCPNSLFLTFLIYSFSLPIVCICACELYMVNEKNLAYWSFCSFYRLINKNERSKISGLNNRIWPLSQTLYSYCCSVIFQYIMQHITQL